MRRAISELSKSSRRSDASLRRKCVGLQRHPFIFAKGASKRSHFPTLSCSPIVYFANVYIEAPRQSADPRTLLFKLHLVEPQQMRHRHYAVLQRWFDYCSPATAISAVSSSTACYDIDITEGIGCGIVVLGTDICREASRLHEPITVGWLKS